MGWQVYRNCAFQGTGDLTRYLVNEDALDFYEALGGHEVISNHATKMLDFAEDLFCKSFGIKPSPIPKDLQAPYLRLIGMYCIFDDHNHSCFFYSKHYIHKCKQNEFDTFFLEEKS